MAVPARAIAFGTATGSNHFRFMKCDFNFLGMSETAVWLAGHRLVLAAAIILVAAWCVAGAALGLPARWFLLSNMFGTMLTLFILLLIQHSQNRDMRALQVKLDELIRSSDAGDHMIGAERLEADELARMAEDRQAGISL